MKRLIASDLHGSAVFCRQLLALYRETGAQQLVLLSPCKTIRLPQYVLRAG